MANNNPLNDNKSQNDKSQNELDLGLGQEDAVTPRKPVQPSESLLDKAKGLKGLFGRKGQPETQFHVRREPTFGESELTKDMAAPTQTIPQPKAEYAEEKVESSAEQVVDNAENNEETSLEADTSSAQPSKQTLAASAAAAATALKRPEKWKLLQILPERHRRLFVTILALVILLMVFFALKPNSDTVESFELQNSNEIPLQFQSLDQSQAPENTVLDGLPSQSESAPQTDQQAQTGSEMPAETLQNMLKPQVAQSNAVLSGEQTGTLSQARKTVAESRHETVKHEALKPAMQERKNVEKNTAEPKTVKVESAPKVPVQEAKIAAKNDHKVQIVEAKPVGNSTKETASTARTSKTLTVPQGVSLMQVFRDNNLNIADVNAMTKAGGAGNALSNFKSGDKVQVSLNAQGRVSELRLPDGAKFVRQSDGSYQFKK